MSESAISCVIQTLRKLQSSETKFPNSICEQLNRIDSKLRLLQTISRVADARQHEDDWIHEWISKTREVAYNAQDLLDIFAIEISTRYEKSILIRRPSERNLNTLHDIESKISLQQTAWQVGNTSSFRQGESLSSVSQRRPQIRPSYSLPEDDFVGLDEDIDKLVSQLINEDVGNCCHVVSVVGTSGIGKTALARRIYHHGDIRDQFHAFAWAVISPQWQPEEVLQRILFELVPERREQIGVVKNIAELIKELFEAQKTVKCLVVLDDVCGTDVWDNLRPAFPNRKSSSKILVTTRQERIARHIDTDTDCYIYEQRLLHDKESWDLLQKACSLSPLLNFSVTGFGSELEDDVSTVGSFCSCQSIEEENELLGNLETPLSPHSEDMRTDTQELGKEMVEQCGGLPLAIILLGQILKSMSSLSEWEALHQSFKSYLRETCAQENARVYEVLALGYHDLPYQIKQCFWHLDRFPKKFKIPFRKLYQLWEAEGLVLVPNSQTSEDDETTMDIAEHHIRELEKRFLVQVQLEMTGSRLKFCHLHELVREICNVKGKEENFRKVIPFLPDAELNVSSSSASEATSTSSSASQTLLSQADSYFEINLTSEEENIEQVRSALFFSRLTDRKEFRDTLKLLCDNFKLLRVLDLERFDFGEHLSESIGYMVHLRFLSFRGSRFNKLPSSIGNLRFLETLDLRVTFAANLSIPDVLWKLSYLKYLYLPPSQNDTNKLQLNTLKSLEILKNFDPRISDFRDISKLNRLRKLSVIFCKELEHLKAINKYLCISTSRITDSSFRIHYNFKSAKELILLDQLVRCVHLQKLDLVGHIEKLPDNFSQNLKKLTLRYSSLKEDPLAILEKLPNLYSLTLRKNAYVGRRFCCSSRGFRQLRNIEVQGLSFLEDWIIEEGSMPNLLQLKLDNCVKLVMLPEGIKFLSTVAEIVVANMPDAFKQNVLQVGASNVVNRVILIDAEQSSVAESEQHPQGNNDRSMYWRSFSPSIVPKNWRNP